MDNKRSNLRKTLEEGRKKNRKEKVGRIKEMNQEDDDDYKIPLKGLAIGNGLTNTEIQYTTYPEMAFDGGKLILFCSCSLLSVRL